MKTQKILTRGGISCQVPLPQWVIEPLLNCSIVAMKEASSVATALGSMST